MSLRIMKKGDEKKWNVFCDDRLNSQAFFSFSLSLTPKILLVYVVVYFFRSPDE